MRMHVGARVSGGPLLRLAYSVWSGHLKHSGCLPTCLPRPLPTCRRHRIQETLHLEQADNGRITVDIEWKPYF